MKKYNDVQSDSKCTEQSWPVLISKVGIYGKIDTNIFFKSSKETDIISVRKSKSCATNSIIESIMNNGFRKR